MPQPMLTTGHCNCRPSSNRQKIYCQQPREWTFHNRSPVALVLTDARSGSVCLWDHFDTSNSIQAGDVLCYDETVCVLSVDDIAATLGSTSLSQHNGPHTRAWLLDPVSEKLTCQHRREHSHATIKTIVFPEECSKTNVLPEECSMYTEYPRLVVLDIAPVNLLSLSLEVDLGPSVGFRRKAPLLHAHWKRQLVGTVFLKSNGVSTKFRLDERVVLSVNSLTAKQKPSRIGTYVVLPSTRITIQQIPQKRCELQRNPPSASSVTKLLLDTIYCVANGIPTASTVLVSGPPGVGKTYSVRSALARSSFNTELISLCGSDLLQQQANPVQALEREFQVALSNADDAVILLFLDECDAIVSVDSMAAMLAVLLDQIDASNLKIVVVGATNRIDSIPAMLRRPGRFDYEIPLAPPTAVERLEILSKIVQEKGRPPNIFEKKELLRMADLCVGYVPADLTALFRQAEYLARQKTSSASPDMHLTQAVYQLECAIDFVGASALRDAALSAPPNTTWDDIAGDPGNAKTLLRQALEWPRLKKKRYEILGLTPPRGILLYGPPGCSKTTLARAAAGASGVSFLSLSPADVYASSYVGEAERVIRNAFTVARAVAPCVLFFDEVDSIFGSGGMARGSSAEARVLSTFLNEIDGIDRKATDFGVLVLGATNRPWTLDSALLRPGRMGDKIIYVPPPDAAARNKILQMQFPGDVHLDFDALAGSCSEGMTGAELIGACQSAKTMLLRELSDSMTTLDQVFYEEVMIKQDYVKQALKMVKPLLSSRPAFDEFRRFKSQSHG
eukprot:scaffold11924_cov118-Cylindrotheca_fusiformis.AAC.2